MNKNLTKKYSSILIVSILLVITAACGNRRHEKPSEKLKQKKDKELINELFTQDDIPFDFFTVRIGVDLKSTAQNASFSCYVKLNIDTAFGGSIKVAGLVYGTYMVTTDSITFVNKIKDCYFDENLNYVSSLFGASVEFDFFQELILGLPIGLDEKTKYQQINSKDHYIIGTHKERDFKKLEQDKLNLEKEEMLIQYHMDRSTLEVNSINIDMPSDTTSIVINYAERKEAAGYRVPEETTISIINPKDTLFVSLNYGSVKINEPKKISIKIPSSYVECP